MSCYLSCDIPCNMPCNMSSNIFYNMTYDMPYCTAINMLCKMLCISMLHFHSFWVGIGFGLSSLPHLIFFGMCNTGFKSKRLCFCLGHIIIITVDQRKVTYEIEATTPIRMSEKYLSSAVKIFL